MNLLNAQQIRASLTEREYDVLRLLITGLSDREIAEILVLTVGTVKWYNRQIYDKLHVRNRVEATAQVQQLELLKTQSTVECEPEGQWGGNYLPAQVTSFIGRDQEIKALQEKLSVSRLVTLTGPPGTGKTRLAIEAAGQLMDYFRDGTFFVSLAPLRDVNLVVKSIAQTLNVKESGSKALTERLQDHLCNKHLLLILDNFEHLLSAAPFVSQLLTTAPHLTILVTSREILRLYGEHEFPVPPLQLPNIRRQELTTLEAMMGYESIELFVRRANAASPSFTIDDKNVVAVGTICVHLDGLPLALELAAARIKYYAPQNLLLRLGSRLEALSEGPRDLPARQRTLRATLAWSYDLLEESEQVLFARLGIFVGGFTHKDVEVICGEGLTLAVGDGLESLLNKSLILEQQRLQDGTRFILLETIREYALEKLHERQEIVLIAEQHAKHFLNISQQTAKKLYGDQQIYWLNWLDAQHDNLRTALRWFLMNDDSGQYMLSLIGYLARFWELKSYLNEGREWLKKALELTGANATTKARADALYGIGAIAYSQCDYVATQSLYENALAIYQHLGDQYSSAQTMISLGEVATEIGDHGTASILFRQAYTTTRDMGDILANARALTQLGFGALRVGEYVEAHAKLSEGLMLYEMENDQVGIALAASGLGEIAIRRNNLDEAKKLLEKSLQIRQELGYQWGIGVSLGSLAWVALQHDDVKGAVEALYESLSIRQEIGDRGGMAWCLEKLALIAYREQEYIVATVIYGYAAFLRRSVNSVIDPSDQADYERIIRELRLGLGNKEFDREWKKGQGMTIEEVDSHISTLFSL